VRREQSGSRPFDGWYQCDATRAREHLVRSADQRPQATGVAEAQLREIQQHPPRACRASGVHPGAEPNRGAKVEIPGDAKDANAMVIALGDLKAR